MWKGSSSKQDMIKSFQFKCGLAIYFEGPMEAMACMNISRTHLQLNRFLDNYSMAFLIDR